MPAMNIAALKEHPAYLATIPKETLTYDMIVSTLENTGSALFYLEKEQKPSIYTPSPYQDVGWH